MKNKLFILGISASLIACSPNNSTNTELSTQIDSVSYSLGISVANNLKNSGFESIETDAIASAFNDVFSDNDVKITEEDANNIVQEYFVELSEKKSKEAVAEGDAFLKENGQREGIVTTATGLQYEVLNKGEGAMPSANDKVTVHYHGT